MEGKFGKFTESEWMKVHSTFVLQATGSPEILSPSIQQDFNSQVWETACEANMLQAYVCHVTVRSYLKNK